MRIAEFAATGRTGHGTTRSFGMRNTAARANVVEFILDYLEDDLCVHEMPTVADA